MRGNKKELIHGAALALAETFNIYESDEEFYRFYLELYKKKEVFANHEYFLLMRDPIISFKIKESLLLRFLKALNLAPRFNNFCLVLLKRNIVYLLSEIVELFLRNGISLFSHDIGVLSSARRFTKQEIALIEKALKKKWKKDRFKLLYINNPEVTSGLIIQTSTRTMNYTIGNMIIEIKKAVGKKIENYEH